MYKSLGKKESVNKRHQSCLCPFNTRFCRGNFQPMNAAVTIQIGLNGCVRAIRRKYAFATDFESFQLIETDVIPCIYSIDILTFLLG